MSKDVQDNKNEQNSSGNTAVADSPGKEDKKDEKLLTAEEVQKLIADKEEEIKKKQLEATNNAVSIEKDKLYATINKHKSEKEALEKELESFRLVEEEKRKKEEEKKKEEMDAKERLKLLEKKQEDDSKRFSEVMEIKEKEFQAQLKKRDLAIYREKKIAEASGAIIPELVDGNNEEEIDKSVELARQRYLNIVEATKKKVTEEVLVNGQLPEPDGKDKKPDEVSDSSGGDWRNLMSMSDEEFLKKKVEFDKEFGKSK
jgi:hypothetical protein